VGRLAADKGIEDLARAWPAIRSAHPDARLLLVGNWEDTGSVSSQARESIESDPSVKVTGFVEDVVQFYEQMSVFVFPTHGSEGFPNAPMEAAASSLPVVATETVGCVDAVVEGSTGTLVPRGSPDRLAEAVIGYLNDPDLRLEQGRAGRLRVESEFRQELIWEGITGVYQEIGRSASVRYDETRGVPA
jgi:glycosyltransferase involved in cell wall biosynthesis